MPNTPEKTTPPAVDPALCQFIEEYKMDFVLGNAVMHIVTCGKPGSETIVENLQKAIWYLDRCIMQCNDQHRAHFTIYLKDSSAKDFCRSHEIPPLLEYAIVSICNFASVSNLDLKWHTKHLEQAKKQINEFLTPGSVTI